MATPSNSQPLLNPSKTTTTQKILLYFLAIATLISLAYLALVTPQSNDDNHHHFLCEKSQNPTSCISLINQEIPHGVDRDDDGDDRKTLQKLLLVHASEIAKAMHKTRRANVQTAGTLAVADCLQLLDLSHDRVVESNKALSKSSINFDDDDDDIRTWLSAVLTNHDTCLDQIQGYSELTWLKSMMVHLVSNSRALLAAHVKVSDISNEEISLKSSRNNIRSYPTWLRRSDRKLLQESGSEIEANVVVSKDGSGDFTTVAAAVASAPDKSKNRYVIYVKAGVYVENVQVGKTKKNVMIVGDGMNLTIITGSLNVVDGNTTFNSATLAAVGDGFILQDICIQNSAGPEKHQAVALRVGADQSVINRCNITAYQDTLYAYSLRQFYTHCSITGTVDFIFGNAAVVFQNCDLIARKPSTSQKSMVTAQGRIDPNQNTGTSIQYCNIIPSSDLAPVTEQFPTFLGRPWKNFSQTVVMQSYIASHIDPAGWSIWDGDFALDTLNYAEYMNFGPGSNTDLRVNWTGYHVFNDPNQARPFTVAEFIQGQVWLDSAGVTYVEGL